MRDSTIEEIQSVLNDFDKFKTQDHNSEKFLDFCTSTVSSGELKINIIASYPKKPLIGCIKTDGALITEAYISKTPFSKVLSGSLSQENLNNLMSTANSLGITPTHNISLCHNKIRELVEKIESLENIKKLLTTEDLVGYTPMHIITRCHRSIYVFCQTFGDFPLLFDEMLGFSGKAAKRPNEIALENIGVSEQIAVIRQNQIRALCYRFSETCNPDKVLDIRKMPTCKNK